MSDELNLEEYDEFDFGFSTVDEDEVKEFETKVQAKVAETTANVSSGLEDKINALLKAREGDTGRVEELEKKNKKIHHNHFDNLSFSKSSFLDKLFLVDSVNLVEGF